MAVPTPGRSAARSRAASLSSLTAPVIGHLADLAGGLWGNRRCRRAPRHGPRERFRVLHAGVQRAAPPAAQCAGQETIGSVQLPIIGPCTGPLTFLGFWPQGRPGVSHSRGRPGLREGRWAWLDHKAGCYSQEKPLLSLNAGWRELRSVRRAWPAAAGQAGTAMPAAGQGERHHERSSKAQPTL